MYNLLITKQAKKDIEKIKRSNLKNKLIDLLGIIKVNPYQNPPPYEQLIGKLSGAISRRLNIQHRLVYQVLEEEKTIKIIRAWTHYE
jgi:Txe/YoeB family toxin of toxin-antitoxin system